MNRRTIREHTFKLLFPVDFHPADEVKTQMEAYFDEDELQSATPEEKALLLGKATEIVEKIPELDPMIEGAMNGWRLPRVGKVELAILRLAVFEMKYDEEVPAKVAINEAIELAKKYGGEDAPGFVNGVLAHIAKDQNWL